MKKILNSFLCDKLIYDFIYPYTDDNQQIKGLAKLIEFKHVKDLDRKISLIIATVITYDGTAEVVNTITYFLTEFEEIWKINLTPLIDIN